MHRVTSLCLLPAFLHSVSISTRGMDAKKRLSRSTISNMKKGELKDILIELMHGSGEDGDDAQISQLPSKNSHGVTLGDIMNELKFLRSQVDELNIKMDELKNRPTGDHCHCHNPTPEKSEKANALLIGDSMIRDVDESKLVNTSVKCLPGATVKRVHDEMQKQPCTSATFCNAFQTDCPCCRH